MSKRVYLVTGEPDVFYKKIKESGAITAYAVQSYCCFEYTLLDGRNSDYTGYQDYCRGFFIDMTTIEQEEYDRINDEVKRLKEYYNSIV